MTWFNRLSRPLQIILLLIPGVNWVVEIAVRWSTFFKRGGLIRFLICIGVTFGGLVIGWIDFFWVLIFGHFFLQ